MGEMLLWEEGLAGDLGLAGVLKCPYSQPKKQDVGKSILGEGRPLVRW